MVLVLVRVPSSTGRAVALTCEEMKVVVRTNRKPRSIGLKETSSFDSARF